MRIKRPFAPKFLNNLDEHLLKNKPETWSARTHLVIYYSLLFIAVLAGLCFIIPNDARGNTSVGYWIGFTTIICIIALVVWLIYLLRFNVFKRFGNTTPLSRLQAFALYFIAIAIIVSFTYIPPLIESARANITYSDNEIINDINNFNIKICQLEYDSLQQNWTKDTVMVSNTKNIVVSPSNAKEEAIAVADSVKAVIHSTYELIDTAQLRSKLTAADSVVKINDSVYVFANSPTYQFISMYRPFVTKGKSSILSSRDLFYQVIKNYKKIDRQKVNEELTVLIKKYYYKNDYYNSYEVDSYNSNDVKKTYRERLFDRYNINIVSRSIENIVDRKDRWSNNSSSWQLRIIFYVSLVITLLIFVFRHSTVKTFFLSLLTGIILTIITSLFVAFSSSYQENSVLIWYIFYTVLFLGLSLSVFKIKNRTIVSGISINLFVLTITFLPIIIVTLYYNNIHSTMYGYESEKFDYAEMYRNIQYAEIGGLVLLIVLLPTLIHNLYRQWFALPED